MLVSLIITVFNVESYLPQCLDSVLAQTHDDIEVILIDDGSTDSSGDICTRYKDSDERIRVLRQENRGIADTRNAGIEASTGDYIVFVDADDRIAEDHVEYLLKLCTDNDADMACCAWTLDDHGRMSKCSYRKNEPGLYKGDHEAMRALLTTRLLSSSVWGKIYKRVLFDEVRFPEGTNYYEDDATMYRLVSHASSVAIGDRSTYYYRLRDDSLIHRTFNDNNLKMISVFEDRCAFIEARYPELAVYAKADILMAVNHCVIKMCDEELFDHPCIPGLKQYYRKYEKYYLKGISYFPAKLFSIVAYINIRLAMRLYRLSGKHTRIN